MITTNALQRTFYIGIGDASGTAFTIDVDNRQYLVTAQHVIDGLGDERQIQIHHDGDWKNLAVEIVGQGDSADVATDVAVLALRQQISPAYSLPPTSRGVQFGQQVYFWDSRQCQA